MSRAVMIVVVLVMVAAAASGAAIYFVQANGEATGMSEEQRITREKFFGKAKELPPIEKGQEMRPRW